MCLPKLEALETQISALPFLPSPKGDLGLSTAPTPREDLEPRAKFPLKSLRPSLKVALPSPSCSSGNGLSPRCCPFLLLNFICIWKLTFAQWWEVEDGDNFPTPNLGTLSFIPADKAGETGSPGLGHIILLQQPSLAMTLPTPRESSFESRWLRPHPQRDIQPSHKSPRLPPSNRVKPPKSLQDIRQEGSSAFQGLKLWQSSGARSQPGSSLPYTTPCMKGSRCEGLSANCTDPCLCWKPHLAAGITQPFFINQRISFSRVARGVPGRRELRYVSTENLRPTTFPVCRRQSISPTSKAWTPTKPLKMKHRFPIFPLQRMKCILEIIAY